MLRALSAGRGHPVWANGPALRQAFISGLQWSGDPRLTRIGLFDRLVEPCEDLDFVLRLAQAGPLVYIPEVLLYYRRHASNVTNRPIYAMARAREVYEHHYRLAALRGDRATATAIAHTSYVNGMHFGKEALRAAKYDWIHGDTNGGRLQLREVALNGRSSARALWRRVIPHIHTRLS